MKLRDFGLLTDENLDSDVVAFLRREGFDVADVCDNSRQGSTDIALLQRAVAANRVVVTHDPDFGKLAILQKEPVVGIMFLRPGHFDPQFTIETVQSAGGTACFKLCAKHRKLGDSVPLRKRSSTL